VLIRLILLAVYRFSLRHDDECNGTKPETYHVMAPTLDYETQPWSWSQCSRDKITEFLEYVHSTVYLLSRLLSAFDKLQREVKAKKDTSTCSIGCSRPDE